MILAVVRDRSWRRLKRVKPMYLTGGAFGAVVVSSNVFAIRQNGDLEYVQGRDIINSDLFVGASCPFGKSKKTSFARQAQRRSFWYYLRRGVVGQPGSITSSRFSGCT
nr:hypothetical protein [Tumebacillus flagellatus]